MAIVVLSDKELDALASALTAPHAFYELGRGPTTVTFNLLHKSQTQVTAVSPVYFLKRNIKNGVSVGCIFRQTKHSSNMLKETTPRAGFRGGGGVETLNSSSKHLPVLGLVLPGPIVIMVVIDYCGPTTMYQVLCPNTVSVKNLTNS